MEKAKLLQDFRNTYNFHVGTAHFLSSSQVPKINRRQALDCEAIPCNLQVLGPHWGHSPPALFLLPSTLTTVRLSGPLAASLPALAPRHLLKSRNAHLQRWGKWVGWRAGVTRRRSCGSWGR